MLNRDRSQIAANTSSIGWISTADALLFSFIFLVIVGFFLDRKVRDRTSAIRRQTEQLQELNQQLDASVGNRIALENQVNELRSELQTVMQERELLHSEFESLQLEIQSAIIRELEFNDKLVNALAERDLARVEAHKAIEAISKQKARLVEVQKNLADRASQIELLKTELAGLSDVGERLSRLESEHQTAIAELQQLKRERESMTTRESRLRKELIGFKGGLGKVILVLDTSASMNNEGRWIRAREIMNLWIELLDMENCALVVFGDNPAVFPADGTYLTVKGEAGSNNRAKIIEFVNGISPQGQKTNTLAALAVAYGYSGIDSVVLFTDGIPNDGKTSFEQATSRIYALCEQHRDIPVNIVGLGEYFHPEFGKFLLRVVDITNGAFIGR